MNVRSRKRVSATLRTPRGKIGFNLVTVAAFGYTAFTMTKRSLQAEYFDQLYADHEDPWNFASDTYELAKYDATLLALGDRRFGRMLEIGCSVGVLSERLADRCDALLSLDISGSAVARATERCKRFEHVEIACMAIPQQFPSGRFDLVVVSEVAYYWSDSDLADAIAKIADAAAGGLVELVHFLPKVDDYPRDGDSAHAAFLAHARYTKEYSQRAERYRLDILSVR